MSKKISIEQAVIVILLGLGIILKNYKREQTKFYILGIAGALAIFLSNVAPIILSVAGLYLLYEQFCTKKNKKIISLA